MKLSNESYFSLNFIARKRLNKEGELPISLRITMNGQRAEIYVNRSVRPDDWCAAKGQSKGKSKRDMELNRYLDTVRTKICEIHNQLQNYKNICGVMYTIYWLFVPNSSTMLLDKS